MNIHISLSSCTHVHMHANTLIHNTTTLSLPSPPSHIHACIPVVFYPVVLVTHYPCSEGLVRSSGGHYVGAALSCSVGIHCSHSIDRSY